MAEAKQAESDKVIVIAGYGKGIGLIILHYIRLQNRLQTQSENEFVTTNDKIKRQSSGNKIGTRNKTETCIDISNKRKIG